MRRATKLTVALLAGLACTTPLRPDPTRIAGGVVDDRGRPLPGVRLSFRDASHLVDVGTSDPAGRFSVQGLRPGEHRITASLFGFHDAELAASPGTSDLQVVLRALPRLRVQVVDSSGRPVPRFEVDDAEVEHPEGLYSMPIHTSGARRLSFRAPSLAATEREFQLTKGAAQDGGKVVLVVGRRVSGLVTSLEGNPIAGALVAVGGLRGIATGPDGRFFLQVDETPQTLSVRHPRYATQTAIPVPAGTDLPPIQLGHGGTLRGHAALPAEAVGAKVFLIPSGGTSAIPVAADGSFTFTGLPPGRYRATLAVQRRVGGELFHQDVELGPGATVPVDCGALHPPVTFEVHTGESCSGLLRGADPLPVPGMPGSTRTTFSMVRPGRYLLTLDCYSGKHLERWVEVTAEARQTLELPE